MYKIANVTAKDIGKAKIQNQKKIIELSGSKLDLLQAFNDIKNESNGFTVDNEKAKRADQLFYELLQRDGISVDNSPKQANDKLRIKEQERARALKLLELKLRLAA